jgi:hypothetical protein
LVVEDTLVMSEAKGSAGAEATVALVDVADGDSPTRAVADKRTDLVAEMSDAVDDVVDALGREPAKLVIREFTPAHERECLGASAAKFTEPGT